MIVDPLDGRQPALTPEAQKRNADLQAARKSRGPADSYTDRSHEGNYAMKNILTGARADEAAK